MCLPAVSGRSANSALEINDQRLFPALDNFEDVHLQQYRNNNSRTYFWSVPTEGSYRGFLIEKMYLCHSITL